MTDLLRARGGHAHCPAALAIQRTVRGTDFSEAARLAHVALTERACRNHALCLWHTMVSLVIAGDLVTADEHADRLLDDLDPRQTGSRCRGAMHAQVRSQLARLSGNLAKARDILADAPAGEDDIRLMSTGLRAEVLAESGAVDEAERLLRSVDVDAAMRTPSTARPRLLAARAAVHSAAGRNLAAYLDYLSCGRYFLTLGVTSTAIVPWRGKAALAAFAIGRADVAVRLASDDLPVARRWGEPRAVGAALATLARVRGDGDTALLTDAVDLLGVAGARSELVTAHLELGRRLAARGDIGAARSSFTSAQTHAAHTRHAQQARAALALLATPGTRTLTRQEELIARLAEAGLTNKAIAARLYLTVHTVEVHLSNVYRKLGITGRERLADALRDRA
jgi:DNA-binding CsgD family transcriptional regulator